MLKKKIKTPAKPEAQQPVVQSVVNSDQRSYLKVNYQGILLEAAQYPNGDPQQVTQLMEDALGFIDGLKEREENKEIPSYVT